VEDACRLARSHKPDVMVLDLHTELYGDAVQRISAESPAMRVLVLTVLEDQAATALQAGAAGYILKSASPAELRESVELVHRGELYVYPALAARLLQSTRKPVEPDAFSTLTVREEQILGHLTRGFSNKEIGRELNLSEKTVKHYVSTLFDKLQVRNRLEAAMLAKGRSKLRSPVS
jgi:two-component system, NarL family, nitrate/nitrite response regulator NarL